QLRADLAIAAEGPGQGSRSKRHPVARLDAVARVPGVPGLAVGVELGTHQFLLGGGRQVGGHQLAGEDLAIVRVPVPALVLRQRLVHGLRDDVLDAGQVRLGAVAVEQRALGEALVDLAAEVVRLHLVQRMVLGWKPTTYMSIFPSGPLPRSRAAPASRALVRADSSAPGVETAGSTRSPPVQAARARASKGRVVAVRRMAGSLDRGRPG